MLVFYMLTDWKIHEHSSYKITKLMVNGGNQCATPALAGITFFSYFFYSFLHCKYMQGFLSLFFFSSNC